MKNFYLLIILIAGLSCNSPQEVAIVGKFYNVPNATVKLINGEESSKIIKIVNVVNGKFEIKIKTSNPNFYDIYIDWPNPHPDTTISPSGKVFTTQTFNISKSIYVDPSQAKIYRLEPLNKLIQDSISKLTTKNVFREISLKFSSSSSDSQLYDFFNQELKKYQIQFQLSQDSLTVLGENALKKRDLVSYTSFSDQTVNLWKGEILPKMQAERRKHFYKHPKSVIVPYLISTTTDLQDHYEEYLTILKRLKGDAANSKYATAAFERLKSFKHTGVKQILPPPAGLTSDGHRFLYDPTKSKLTLIEFWASWCVPCRASNPDLIKAYHQYKNLGFNIIGVSIDTDSSKWKKAIKDDKLPWINISDLKSMEKSENTARYNIVEIPQNFVVDGRGRIIAVNVFHEDLIKMLNTYLN